MNHQGCLPLIFSLDFECETEHDWRMTRATASSTTEECSLDLLSPSSSVMDKRLSIQSSSHLRLVLVRVHTISFFTSFKESRTLPIPNSPVRVRLNTVPPPKTVKVVQRLKPNSIWDSIDQCDLQDGQWQRCKPIRRPFGAARKASETVSAASRKALLRLGGFAGPINPIPKKYEPCGYL